MLKYLSVGVQNLKGLAQQLPLPNCILVGFLGSDIDILYESMLECRILSNSSKAGEVGLGDKSVWQNQKKSVFSREFSIFQKII